MWLLHIVYLLFLLSFIFLSFSFNPPAAVFVPLFWTIAVSLSLSFFRIENDAAALLTYYIFASDWLIHFLGPPYTGLLFVRLCLIGIF